MSSALNRAKAGAKQVSKDLSDLSKTKATMSIKVLWGIGFAITAWLIAQSSIAINEGIKADDKQKPEFVFSAISLAISCLVLLLFIGAAIASAMGSKR